MGNIIISTTDDYIVVKIPKQTLAGHKLSSRKKLTTDEALKIFAAAQKDYQTGKLNEVESLAQLL